MYPYNLFQLTVSAKHCEITKLFQSLYFNKADRIFYFHIMAWRKTFIFGHETVQAFNHNLNEEETQYLEELLVLYASVYTRSGLQILDPTT